MTVPVVVITFYCPTPDQVATYADWLREVHIPESVDLIDGIAAGQLFALHDEQRTINDPLVFPLFSLYELTDDPARVFDRATSIERQPYDGIPVHTRTTVQAPVGNPHGSHATGQLVVVEFAQYPTDLRARILEHQRAQWLAEVSALGSVVAVQQFEKCDFEHPPVPFSAPMSYRDLTIWELQDGVGRWLDARSDAGLDAGLPDELSEPDLVRASLSTRRSGAFVRLGARHVRLAKSPSRAS
ncbi:MAG TPA: hypothetical protein VMH39_14060 [Gemmatimonadaceae bacterium]|nr:hypothetical protein [Gemmatimonadaceae bacterium]